MYIERIQLGLGFYTNCYLVSPDQQHCLVIDPGAEGARILNKVQELKWQIEKIILTHGHFDHIGAVDYLRQVSGSPVYIHAGDEDCLVDAQKNLSALFAQPLAQKAADSILQDQEQISVAGEELLTVIHTPGHSPGSICLYNQKEGILFTGDTIFALGVGRTDFPYAENEKLVNSIEEKLLPLPPETIIYPGHGSRSSLGRFKKRVWSS